MVKENSESQTSPASLEPIAIIGMSCRYPGGVNSPEAFWHLLRDEVDAIGEVPADRYDIEQYYAPDRQPGKIVTREAGFLSEDIRLFDPLFFGIAPREAIYIDPQQRLLLEVAWEALESGGQVTRKLAGSKTGVFLGMWATEYKERMYAAIEDLTLHVLTGSSLYPASGRLSFLFDFQGPSMVVDTACSSSLVAIHLACQSLWQGESTMALAGGVNIMLNPELSIAESRSGMLSPDARCKFGDAGANGYVRSEGAGIVVLKPLSQAQADADPIFALIRSSATNNDGRSGGVLSAPGYEAQVTLLREAYQRAGISPGAVGYMEAHGTGTPTGDPIEVRALGTVLGENRAADDPCLIGSLKTNIGHSEPASGVASVIKTALCLQHQAIPASLHFTNPNPNIPWSELPLKMQTAFSQWPQNGQPLYAGVNSFGVTGTNAHVVMQSAPPDLAATDAIDPANVRPELIVLTGHTPQALHAVVAAYQAFLQPQDRRTPLPDLAYTTTVRRAHHNYRAAFVAQTPAELKQQLAAFLSDGRQPSSADERDRPLAFVFTGMGPQWWGMGRELLQTEPVFRQAIIECDAHFQPIAGWSLMNALLDSEENSRMARTDVAQPTNFALQLGLAALWQSWGIKPDAIIGHSTGEIAAAAVSGMLSLPDALRVAYHRSRLQQLTTGEGKMLAVGLPEAAIQPYLQGHENLVSIAAINSFQSVTLAGDATVLAALETKLKAAGIFARFLYTDVPYHSPKMDRLRAQLLAELQGIECHPATVPVYTTVDGKRAETSAFGAAYWWRNVRQPVLFAQAITQMIGDGYHHFLEVGPHPVLAMSIQECLQEARQAGSVIPSLRRQYPERQLMLQSLGALFTLGKDVAWERVCPRGRCLGHLPLYPWQRSYVWYDQDSSGKNGSVRRRKGQTRSPDASHPLLGQHIASASFPGTHLWETMLPAEPVAYLTDHRVRGLPVFPAAAYIEMMLAGSGAVSAVRQHTLTDIVFHEAFLLPAHNQNALQLTLSPGTGDRQQLQIHSRPISDGHQQSDWTLHASGQISAGKETMLPKRDLLHQTPAANQETISTATHYNYMRQRSLEYGPAFQRVAGIWSLSATDAIAKIQLTAHGGADGAGYCLHPTLLDAGFQVLLTLAISRLNLPDTAMYLPVGVERLDFYHSCTDETAWCQVTMTPRVEDAGIVGDIRYFDTAGQVLAEVHGLRCQKIERSTRDLLTDWLYEVSWRPLPFDHDADGMPATPGTWIILADTGEIGRDVARQLTAKGDHCVLVEPGATYERVAEAQYRIDPADPQTYQRLLQDCLSHDRPACRGIVNLWGLNRQTAHPEMMLEEIWAALSLAGQSVLGLVQAISVYPWTEMPRLWLAASGAQRVTEDDAPPRVDQAAWWGLSQVIALEHPELKTVYLDLDAGQPDQAASALFAELWRQDRETAVAWRGETRFGARLGRCPVPPEAETVTVHAHGSYLITGGLGGLGLQVARWLSEKGARHVILTSRRGVLDQAQQAIVTQLQQNGTNVVIARADVAAAADVAQLLAEIKQNQPPLRGIVHAAGVIEDGILRQQRWDQFERVLLPKVAGAWYLHNHLRDEALDFVVYFSSIASSLGSAGQGNYAAANAFMDALAGYRRAKGLPALSLNWGPWAEVGMAARGSERDQARWRDVGVQAIMPAMGVAALEALLQQPTAPPSVTIVNVNWGQYLQQFSQHEPRPFFDAFRAAVSEQTAAARGKYRQQLEASPIHKRRGMLIEHVRRQIQEVLRLSAAQKIGPRQRIFDLGMDSLMALELRNRFEFNFDRPIRRATLLFDYPTLEALTDYLIAEVLDLPFSAEPSPRPEESAGTTTETDWDSLSQDAIASLLAEKLSAIQQHNERK